MDRSHFKRPTDISASNTKLTSDDIFVIDRRSGRRERSELLRRGLLDKGIEEVCECGQGVMWNNKSLKLEIDHIDGNCLNNTIANLRFICPNCHTQTDTYGYKGKQL